MVTRRAFIAGSAVLSAGAALGVYAWQVEPHWVEIVRRPMLIGDLPAELEGRTLLQLSDLHVGHRVSSSYLMESFARARELSPDYVAFTGDFVSYRSAHEYRELARVLATFPRGRRGTVGVLGNHDYGPMWEHVEIADQVTSVARDAGIDVLRNQVRVIDGLQFAGLADLWGPEFGPSATPPLSTLPAGMSDAGPSIPVSRKPDSSSDARTAIAAIARGMPTVVLAHNPDAQDLPIWGETTAWVLAGHTHGGQVKPPFLPPPILPVRNKRYTRGEFVVSPQRRLYISRGLGHLTQVRFNVRPEMTLFTLTRG